MTYSVVGTGLEAWDSLLTEGRCDGGETGMQPGARISRSKGADTGVKHDAELHVEQSAETRRTNVIGRKRVVLVSIGRGPSDPRAMQKEARSLASRGYEVTYICNAASGPMVTDNDVQVNALKMPTGRVGRQMLGPRIALREALSLRPDVVHVFDLALIGPALRFGRQHDAKVVVDLPEDNAKQILQKNYLGPMAVRKMVSRVYRRMSQRWLPQADLVVAATPSIVESLPPGCHQVVVRNFPTIAEIDAVPPFELAANMSSTSVLRVVYTGGIGAIRGIRELVVATGMLRGAAELHLAGPIFDSRFLGELEAMAEWQYCHYHGWLNWQDSIALVKACDVGACVSRTAPNQVESLPVKVFEYMACGRGSLVSAFPLWRRLFIGAALFVDPTKPASLARLMEQLLAKPALRQRLSENGRLLAEARYSWESEAVQLADAYAGLWRARWQV